MAKSGRPSRLLNLQNSPALKKTIAATNATSSSFLKLPAEIRQRIYNYALGGNILHVASYRRSDRTTGTGPVVICTCPHDYDYPGDASRLPIRHEASICEYFEFHNSGIWIQCFASHKQCYQNSSAQKRFSVHLLQTCRQIYHEAVLVPFQANTFSLTAYYPSSNPTGPVKFLNSLVPAQIKAISHIILQPIHTDVCTWNQLKRLMGLVTMQYILLVGHPFSDPKSWADDKERGFAKAKLEKLAELPNLRNVSMELRTYPRGQPALDGSPPQVPDPMKTWVASAERRMLAGTVSQVDA